MHKFFFLQVTRNLMNLMVQNKMIKTLPSIPGTFGKPIWLPVAEGRISATSDICAFYNSLLRTIKCHWFDVESLFIGMLKWIYFEFQNTEGQWVVALTIQNLKKEDTLVPYKLEVTNSQGKNEYEVRLQTDNEPGPGIFISSMHLCYFCAWSATTQKNIKSFRT